MNIGIILSGGTGTRFGSQVPKQYQRIQGREVIDFSIEALMGSSAIHKIIVVAQESVKSKLIERYPIMYVEGGETRNKSLKNALNFINSTYLCDKIIVLEAARPMVTSSIIDLYLSKLDIYDAVITGQKIVDSLGTYSNHITNREDYYLIQAPEAFIFQKLYNSFDEDSKITATNQQMPIGSKLFINFDFKDNYKITYPQDLKYIESMMDKRKNENI
ncbi:MAG: putative 2-C-methyl-D-erythritol 4-phosphate cytidylyltransferase 2 [Firmicutes bacterium ADurb.Bin080]|nr:MAG: putative 2-C-methyl-D-erythritol 4-phosphate cytidylyltransferase 2 [Firmicutes bacterium ADurb.Bin080]